MSDLMESWRKVVAEAPNFVTDERADIKDNKGVTKRTYRFLALSTLLANLKPLFDKHGIMFTQPINYQYGGDGKGMQVPTVDTVIFNGEESQTLSQYPIVLTADPQAVGSQVTYARRYSLYSVLGIFPEKDDDGATARDYANAGPKTITDAQCSTMLAEAKAKGMNAAAVCKQVTGTNLSSPMQLTTDQYTQVMSIIREA